MTTSAEAIAAAGQQSGPRQGLPFTTLPQKVLTPKPCFLSTASSSETSPPEARICATSDWYLQRADYARRRETSQAKRQIVWLLKLTTHEAHRKLTSSAATDNSSRSTLPEILASRVPQVNHRLPGKCTHHQCSWALAARDRAAVEESSSTRQ